jgi:hypothetical protein
MEQAMGHARILTRAVLSLVRHKRLAAFLVRRLARAPELYSNLLAINCGVRTFWNLSFPELLGFVLGRRQKSRGDS